MSTTLCDVCHEQMATVFITKIVNNEATKVRLCESCARQRAAGESWMQQLVGGDVDALQNLPLDEMVINLLQQIDASLDATSVEYKDGDETDFEEALEPDVDIMFSFGEFPADEDLVDEMDEADSDETDDDDDTVHQLINLLPLNGDEGSAGPRERRAVPAQRCPKCSTTWDRLKQDGRAGCAHCYEVFADQLSEVMERVQRSAQHLGKQPRAAQKRRRRLEHLRARRDHRLAMLQRRLQDAVAAEKYEDAAKLRDKIKIVSSTIVSDER